MLSGIPRKYKDLESTYPLSPFAPLLAKVSQNITPSPTRKSRILKEQSTHTHGIFLLVCVCVCVSLKAAVSMGLQGRALLS